VSVLHRAGQGLDQMGGVARRLRGAGDLLPETAAVDVFQGEIRASLLLADFVDLHDVRVLQLGHGFGFVAEARQLLGPGMGAGQDHLQGYQAVEFDMPRPVDDPHAAAPQDTEDFVTGDKGMVAGCLRRQEAWRLAHGGCQRTIDPRWLQRGEAAQIVAGERVLALEASVVDFDAQQLIDQGRACPLWQFGQVVLDPGSLSRSPGVFKPAAFGFHLQRQGQRQFRRRSSAGCGSFARFGRGRPSHDQGCC
jgi:hypothetical protein